MSDHDGQGGVRRRNVRGTDRPRVAAPVGTALLPRLVCCGLGFFFAGAAIRARGDGLRGRGLLLYLGNPRRGAGNGSEDNEEGEEAVRAHAILHRKRSAARRGMTLVTNASEIADKSRG